MTRYITRAAIVTHPTIRDLRTTFGKGAHCDHTFEIHEADPYRGTGILDAKGQTIWATDKAPLGFGRAG